MPHSKSLKRITDPHYLLCHRCGLPLRGFAHRKCAEEARVESGQVGKEPPKIKRALKSRPFEGIGTIGHSLCRLEDGSTIVPADEVRKIREEGFTSNQTGVKYSPWTNNRIRERRKMISKKDEDDGEDEVEDTVEDEEKQIEELIEEQWDIEDGQDLFFLVNGYPVEVYMARLRSADLPEEDSEHSDL